MTSPSSPTGPDWSAASYRHNAHFVYSAAFSAPVVELLNPASDETILDLGCGSGELTEQLGVAVGQDGSVLGIDASSSMINGALKANKQPNVKYQVLDGHDLDKLDADTYDAVFSNAALHWMKTDPHAVVRGVHNVLKHGGRFAAEMGGYMNIVGIRASLHGALRRRGIDTTTGVDPWFFPSPAYYSDILDEAGFTVESIELVPRVTPLPTGIRGWINAFAFDFLKTVPQADREAFITEVEDELRVDLQDVDGTWACMYMRLRFLATKPEKRTRSNTQ